MLRLARVDPAGTKVGAPTTATRGRYSSVTNRTARFAGTLVMLGAVIKFRIEFLRKTALTLWKKSVRQGSVPPASNHEVLY